MPVHAHPILGPVTVVRSTRARRLTISVRATGEIRLTIPAGVGDVEAFRFLDEKQVWTAHTRDRLRHRHPERTITEPFSTRNHTLRLEPVSGSSASFRIREGAIRVCYPEGFPVGEKIVQETIRKAIEETWRIEAKEYLPRRVAELCATLGFRCGKVTIRNTRSRWGSCSPSNDLSLSLHLMKLPGHLIDYIVIHELCHTRHKNHGPRFHALLDNLTQGRHRQLRKELKQYSTRWN